MIKLILKSASLGINSPLKKEDTEGFALSSCLIADRMVPCEKAFKWGGKGNLPSRGVKYDQVDFGNKSFDRRGGYGSSSSGEV